MAVVFKPKDSFVFREYLKSGYVICHITMHRRDWLLRKKKKMVRTRLVVTNQDPVEYEDMWVCDVSRNFVKPPSNNTVLMEKFHDWLEVRDQNDLDVE